MAATAGPKDETEAPRPRSGELHVLVDSPRSGSRNLAIDEALLDAGGSWLRLYAWEPATVSLGYFQRHRDFAEVAKRYALVRRCTGGGAILHERELTFALAVPEALLPMPIASGYDVINDAIRSALSPLGASLRSPSSDEAAETDSHWCFASPNGLDLVIPSGRKAVGSAQRRRGGRILHHGSIVLQKPTGQDFCAAIELEWEQVAKALEEEIPKALRISSRRVAELPSDIIDNADVLERERYGRAAWLERR